MNVVRLFGKLPAHGDFVARGIDAAERDALDAWLAGQLDSNRERLGEAFAPRYDSAPPWRFVLPEADTLSAGALTPSVDAAGRRFPIWLALANLAPNQGDAAAQACEELLYAALADGWNADALAEAAAGIVPATGALHDTARWWTQGSETRDATELVGARPDSLFSTLLQRREEDA